jgi:hypothetical protein
MDADIADMKEVLANAGETSRTQVVRAAIQTVKTRPQLPEISGRHIPAKTFEPGKPMEIGLELESQAKRVDLYYRHANQALDWQVMPMEMNGSAFKAVIPGEYTKTRYPMTYYFAVDMGEEGIAIFPGLDENQANMPYYVVQQ